MSFEELLQTPYIPQTNLGRLKKTWGDVQNQDESLGARITRHPIVNNPTVGLIESGMSKVAPFTAGMAQQAIGGLGAASEYAKSRLSGKSEDESLQLANMSFDDFMSKTNGIIDSLTYKPQTEYGKQYSETVDKAMEAPTQVGTYIGDKLADAGYPNAAATVSTAIQGAPFIFGGIKSGRSVAKPFVEGFKNLAERGSIEITNPFYSQAERAITGPKFYSEAANLARKLPDTMKGDKVESLLKRAFQSEFPKEPLDRLSAEFKSLNIKDAFERGQDVSKQQVIDFIEQNTPRLGEDVYGTRHNPREVEIMNQILQLQERERNISDMMYDYRQMGKDTTRLSEGRDKIKQQLRDLWKEQNSIAETNQKQPQFPDYKAIKSEEGVIPGSYAEEFVTADLPGSALKQFSKKMGNKYGTEDAWQLVDKMTPDELTEWKRLQRESSNQPPVQSWVDEHSQYSDTKNPMIRLRYDVKELSDGRRVMRVHEFQTPDPVKKSQKGGGVVPQPLAERSMELGVKQALAKAKQMGLDGIEWATGEQTKDLYNYALRSMADEARWNPETEQLTLYKNGTPADRANNAIPKRVPKEDLEKYIGKSGAQRLLDSKIDNKLKNINFKWLPADESVGFEPWQVKLGAEYFIDGELSYNVVPDKYPSGSDSKVKWSVEDQDGKQLSKMFDSKNEAKNYVEDRFTGADKQNRHIATDLSIDATWPTKLYGDFVEIGPKVMPEKYQLTKSKDGYWRVEDKYTGDEMGLYNTPEEALAELGEPGVSFGDFNYNATIPKLLKKHGKGEFGVGESGQPQFMLDKDSPSSFPIYAGNPAIQMLYESYKNAGGGIKGAKDIAKKIGIGAAGAYLLNELFSDKTSDERKKQIIAMPVMAGLTAYHGTKGELKGKYDAKLGKVKDHGYLGKGLMYFYDDPRAVEMHLRNKYGKEFGQNIVPAEINDKNLYILTEKQKNYFKQNPKKAEEFTQYLIDNNYDGSMIDYGMLKEYAIIPDKVKYKYE